MHDHLAQADLLSAISNFSGFMRLFGCQGLPSEPRLTSRALLFRCLQAGVAADTRVAVDVWQSGVIVFRLLIPQASFSCSRNSFSRVRCASARTILARPDGEPCDCVGLTGRDLWTARVSFRTFLSASCLTRFHQAHLPTEQHAFGTVIWAGRWCYWKLANLSTPSEVRLVWPDASDDRGMLSFCLKKMELTVPCAPRTM